MVTTFKIGGPPISLIASADDLAVAVTAARDLGIDYFVLGLGANILVGDKGFRGLVIRNTSSHLQFRDNGRLWVESGAVMAKLIPQAVERGLSGLEHYVGIPSTVGGLSGRISTFFPPPGAGEDDVHRRSLQSAELSRWPSENRRPRWLNWFDTSAAQTARRTLAVTFKLDPADTAVASNHAGEPGGGGASVAGVSPSAGSIFKKIEGVGAGRLIDQVGLKASGTAMRRSPHIPPASWSILAMTARDVRAHRDRAGQGGERFGQHLRPESVHRRVLVSSDAAQLFGRSVASVQQPNAASSLRFVSSRSLPIPEIAGSVAVVCGGSSSIARELGNFLSSPAISLRRFDPTPGFAKRSTGFIRCAFAPSRCFSLLHPAQRFPLRRCYGGSVLTFATTLFPLGK
jgi:UDP-N-acetylmuramate dehydrogenase